MKVTIQNLGAIKDAEIDLSKKLTVFCGPNNSGKTYAAFMIYALTKSGLKFYKSVNNDSIIQDLLIKKNATFELNSNEIWKYRESEILGINNSLDSIYGISEDIVKNLFSDFNIQIKETKKEFEKKISQMSFENVLNLKDLYINISKQENSNVIELTIDEDSVSKNDIEYLKLFLNSKLLSLVAFYPFTTSYIQPVERNSIYTFSKELSIKKQEFLDRAQELSSKNSKDPFHWLMKRSTRYPMAIRDGLEIAEDLSNYSKNKSEFYEFAEEIENELLQGKVILTKEGEVQFCSNKAKRKKIPIHLTASIVKTLSSLVFYLKYIATKNELIIIDEPELNLHPNNQVTLTRIFTKLINKGFRLLISTHSDYIIRELNNLIMISSKKEGIDEIKSKFNYDNDVCIDPNDISAYLFNYQKKNSRNVTVKKLKINETGFEVSTIDETIDSLNEISEELFYSLKYSEKIKNE